MDEAAVAAATQALQDVALCYCRGVDLFRSGADDRPSDGRPLGP